MTSQQMVFFLRDLWAREPAVLGWAANGGAAAVAAFAFRASPAQTAAVATAVTALAAAFTALRTRPVAVPAVTGAVTVIATAAGSFGLHLQSGQIAAATAALSALLALLTRQNVSPAQPSHTKPS